MNVEVIKDFLIKKASAQLIILFGSAVTGRMRQDSDIDIAFLSNKNLDVYEVYLISQELSSLLGRDIDLIDLKKASTVFKANILATGKIIYFADENIKCDFQIRTLKAYCLLNEERKLVLDKIRERGKIYGE